MKVLDEKAKQIELLE